jgi:hypothetical protein
MIRLKAFKEFSDAEGFRSLTHDEFQAITPWNKLFDDMREEVLNSKKTELQAISY